MCACLSDLEWSAAHVNADWRSRLLLESQAMLRSSEQDLAKRNPSIFRSPIAWRCNGLSERSGLHELRSRLWQHLLAQQSQ